MRECLFCVHRLSDINRLVSLYGYMSTIFSFQDRRLRDASVFYFEKQHEAREMHRSTFTVNIYDSALFVCDSEWWSGDSRGMTVIPQSFVRRVHRLFQREFSRECELVSPLSIYSIISFLKIIQQLLTSSSSPSLPVYPSITCFRR